MKRTTIVFGILAGLIVSAIMIISIPLMRSSHEQTSPYSMLVGYASMLLAFSLIFVAIRTQRDKYEGGTITFGRAFLVGLGVALIGSVFYTLTWIILYKNFYPTFMDDMVHAEIANLSRAGASAAKISAKRAELDEMRAVYNTWPGLIGWTMIEILPVGVLIALIAALVMKRKRRVAGPAEPLSVEPS